MAGGLATVGGVGDESCGSKLGPKAAQFKTQAAARDAQLHPSLTSHPVIPIEVEILKTYLCRGESRNNGSAGDESPGREGKDLASQAGRQPYPALCLLCAPPPASTSSQRSLQ